MDTYTHVCDMISDAVFGLIRLFLPFLFMLSRRNCFYMILMLIFFSAHLNFFFLFFILLECCFFLFQRYNVFALKADEMEMPLAFLLYVHIQSIALNAVFEKKNKNSAIDCSICISIDFCTYNEKKNKDNNLNGKRNNSIFLFVK